MAVVGLQSSRFVHGRVICDFVIIFPHQIIGRQPPEVSAQFGSKARVRVWSAENRYVDLAEGLASARHCTTYNMRFEIMAKFQIAQELDFLLMKCSMNPDGSIRHVPWVEFALQRVRKAS